MRIIPPELQGEKASELMKRIFDRRYDYLEVAEAKHIDTVHHIQWNFCDYRKAWTKKARRLRKKETEAAETSEVKLPASASSSSGPMMKSSAKPAATNALPCARPSSKRKIPDAFDQHVLNDVRSQLLYRKTTATVNGDYLLNHHGDDLKNLYEAFGRHMETASPAGYVKYQQLPRDKDGNAKRRNWLAVLLLDPEKGVNYDPDQ